jgi:hypothetical protein
VPAGAPAASFLSQCARRRGALNGTGECVICHAWGLRPGRRRVGCTPHSPLPRVAPAGVQDLQQSMQARLLLQNGVMSTSDRSWLRAIRIGFRTLHIGAIAMLLGAAGFDQATEPWLTLTLLTGGSLVALDVRKGGGDYFRYLQSWAVLAKLILLSAAVIWPALLIPALWSALVIGSVISHAPGGVRQFALWGRPGPCARHGICSTVPHEAR